MILFIIAIIIFVIADIIIRVITKKVREKNLREEREKALHVDLKIDFTNESKSLKRVEVQNPRARILCVDDEPIILDSFRKILVLDGYNVDTVETGQEALGLVQKHSYDFVFTDLKMPHMDGLEVTKAVKHLRPDIDVAIITGYATVETAVDCMKFGAMDYVQKPFTERELLEFTNHLLLKRQERIKSTIKPQVKITSVHNLLGLDSHGFAIPGGVFLSDKHSWLAIEQEGRVKVGLDDFANKLIGKIDKVEFPNLGMDVIKDNILFTVYKKNRAIPFKSPISGKVIKVNNQLSNDTSKLEQSPYQENWICTLDADDLDSELQNLKIGKSAITLYQEDLENLRILHNKIRTGNEKDDFKPEEIVEIGEMENVDDNSWERYIKEFFE